MGVVYLRLDAVKTIGDISVSVAAPKIWNRLPLSRMARKSEKQFQKHWYENRCV